MTVLTDHSAVKAILETPTPSGKHARWWNKVFGSGVARVNIVYRAEKDNSKADGLSRNPPPLPPGIDEAVTDVQVASVTTTTSAVNSTPTMKQFLSLNPALTGPQSMSSFGEDPRKDSSITKIADFLTEGTLLSDDQKATKVTGQSYFFTLVDDILYYLGSKRGDQKRAAVPKQLRAQMLEENHGGRMAGHCSGNQLYKTLAQHWWWEGMYADSLSYCKNCPEWAIVSGGGRVPKPPLHAIPISRPFQIVGVDIMELPKTKRGNQYVIVLFTKWPLAFPAPDQKFSHIARLLVEEIVPLFGVPEALLSDQGTNLLSHLMLNVCQLLEIKKLNTTAYHSQCDSMVERFNCTLKAMLWKRVDQFGAQWDKTLSAALWTYHNTPHESTGEKLSFLLLGMDCRSPTEAALLPPTSATLTNIKDYRDEIIESLSTAHEASAKSIQQAQQKYKTA